MLATAVKRIATSTRLAAPVGVAFRPFPAINARSGFLTRGYASGATKTLVVAEHKDDVLNPSTLNAITAAKALGGGITALVAGSNTDKVVKAIAKADGIEKVIVAKAAEYDHALPEVFAPLVVEAAKKLGYSHVVAGHTAFGKNVIPRAAALLDVQSISDVTAVEGADTFVRPIYAGNAISKVKSKDNVKVITIRTTAFPAAGSQGSEAPVEDAPTADKPQLTKWEKEEIAKSDRPELASAKIVVAGGRALKSAENFKILYDLADHLGGAVGASRAAVDAGYAENSLQIGQTGKIVAPQLYIAVGISGAIQHLAGMKDSKCIVAINKDADSPIFQIADYGLVGDLFQLVPELTEKLKK